MENEQVTAKKTTCNEMRKAWFDYVRKNRAKLSRGKKEKCSHRDAMKAASEGWVLEKVKGARKIPREKKKVANT